MRKGILSIVLALFLAANTVYTQSSTPEDFHFVFMTDIHLQYGRNAPEGFQQAIDTINKLKPDFVLSGGDLISDALKARYSQADSLYSLYQQMTRGVEMPVYNTVGNHELYGLDKRSGADSLHPDYYDGMYKRFLGDPYYSFDHKGWHFIVLNSNFNSKGKVVGYIGDEQIEWLKNDLAKIDTETPIIISSHIPFISTSSQLKKGSLAANNEGMIVSNSIDVIKMFNDYNLKLILQGHLHIVEYVTFHNGLKFLVGGAVSAGWWKGPNSGMEEGFMHIHLRGEEIDWEYVDYGWKVD